MSSLTSPKKVTSCPGTELPYWAKFKNTAGLNFELPLFSLVGKFSRIYFKSSTKVTSKEIQNVVT